MIKKDILKDESKIEVVQLHPKLRLFLLIFFSWFISLFPFWFIPCWILIPCFHQSKYLYIPITLIISFVILTFLYLYFFPRTGIKYLPKDLNQAYLIKNQSKLQKIKNFEVVNVNHFFNVTPICDEVLSKKQKNFTKLSLIESSCNRLIVNGKIEDLDFSWGVVTKMKRNNFKIFLLAIWYFGPIFGISWGLIPKLIVNEAPDEVWKTKKSWKYFGPFIFFFVLFILTVGDAPTAFPTSDWPEGNKYNKYGMMDLFPHAVGKLSSENYLIFSAKLQTKYDLMTLIPKVTGQEPLNLNNQYDWPLNLSDSQKQDFQNLIKTMKILPNIYLDHDKISIVMKKYDYNAQDNQELQTWELLKEANSNNEVQFNYLDQAIKIYQIFNQKEEQDEI